ncbi:MAG: phosphate acyltransferase PlsX [Planctomycetota bacterium]
MSRIAVDAMGGDHGPAVVVDGIVEAAQRFAQHHIIVLGDEPQLQAEFSRHATRPSNIEIMHAAEVVAMHDSPVDALRRKPDSSMRKMISLVKQGGCDAAFSTGNTGAMVAGSTMLLGLLPGVRRSGIAIPMPTGDKPVILVDVGANVECKAAHLYQYGLMAAVYAERVFGVKSPAVGLLNVGEEEGKGNQLVKETRELFKASRQVRYFGNVEGDDIFRGECDVVVCDGFVGNIVLKTAEGISELLMTKVGELLKSVATAAAAAGGANASTASGLRDTFKKLAARYDYAEYGGAPLLGVNGIVLIGHGRSNARAVVNAIAYAGKMVAAGLNQALTAVVAESGVAAS